MARGSTARRRRRWRQLAARLLAAVDRRVLAVVVLLWGIGCLRFLVGGGEAVWGGLTLLVLATAGFFGARTWGLPVLGSLLAERTLLTSWREQGIFSFLGELSLQALVAFGAPLLGRLNRRSLARERREEQRLRDEARDSLTDDAPGQGKALDPAAAFERAEASTLAMVQLLKQSLRCQTALFAWAGEEASLLTVGAIASDVPDAVRTGAFSIRDGRFAGACRSASPLVLRYGDGLPEPPYYREGSPVRITEAMAIPVFMRRRLLGVFFLDRAEAIPFYLPDSALADRARRVVTELAEVSKELLQANQTIARLASLNDAAAEIGRARSFEEVYRTIVSASVRLTRYRHAILSHRLSDRGALEIVAVTDPSLAPLLGKQHAAEEGLCGLARTAGGPFPSPWTTRLVPVPRPFGDGVPLDLDPGENHLMLPVVVQDRPVAFLLMAGGEVPDRSQVEVLKLLGNLAGTALVNAESNQDLARLATTDPLTGLPNQRQLRARLTEAKARHDRMGTPFSLLFLDIDHFKRINDSYGHAAGDTILHKVATILAGQVRRVDLAARYGGEEFAVVLEDTDRSGALVMGERIRAAVSALELGDMGIASPVTVSVGIASIPTDCADTDSLLVTADEALYQAKRDGRNRCVLAA